MIVGGITGGLVVLLLSVVLTAIQGGESIGSIYNNVRQQFDAGIDVTGSGDIMVDGVTAIDASRAATLLEKSESITADNTITVVESGTTYYVDTNFSTSTLPAVAGAAGTVYRFVIASAVSTNDFRVVSAEGDNIEGALIVAGAVVTCDAADAINFITDGENLGDYVEVRSNGSKWYVTQSSALTSAKMTCSG